MREDTVKPSNLPSDSLIPIRTIANLTGVNPVTLRAWERRYRLIEPVRTPKGHRLYSMADVDLIKQVLALLEGGMSISQVKRILDATPYQDSAAADGRTANGSDNNRAANRPGAAPLVELDEQTRGNVLEIWQTYQKRLIKAIGVFDEAQVNDIYNEILALYPIDIVTTRLTVPLLKELGWRWQRGGSGRIAEEHFFSVFLRNRLGARFHHRNRRVKGPTLLTACLPKEQHEMGILLFSLVAQDWNYSIILLGANTPLAEVGDACARARVNAVVLSGSLEPDAELLNDQLPALVAKVDVPVFIGGRIADRFSEPLAQTGAKVLGSEFSVGMRKINDLLQPVN